MTRTPSPTLALLAALLSAACSSSSTSAARSGAGSDAGGVGKGWSRIIEGSWTLGPGEEKERLCVKQLLTEDVYVRAIRPVSPTGTHHTLLTLGDGTIDCTTAVAGGLIYAAGIGSTGLELPEGVAIKLPKGKYLNLGLHIYNTSDQPLSGTSAMEVETLPADQVKYESEALLAGPLTLQLPPGQQTVIHNDCQITADQSVYALFPHMHQLGKHFKTTLTQGGVANVIHDADYSFVEQYQLPLDPILDLHPGDKVTTECTYDNTTGKTVTFGESTDTEMCFSILFRYPPQGRGICFSRNPTPTADAGP